MEESRFRSFLLPNGKVRMRENQPFSSSGDHNRVVPSWLTLTGVVLVGLLTSGPAPGQGGIALAAGEDLAGTPGIPPEWPLPDPYLKVPGNDFVITPEGRYEPVPPNHHLQTGSSGKATAVSPTSGPTEEQVIQATAHAKRLRAEADAAVAALADARAQTEADLAKGRNRLHRLRSRTAKAPGKFQQAWENDTTDLSDLSQAAQAKEDAAHEIAQAEEEAELDEAALRSRVKVAASEAQHLEDQASEAEHEAQELERRWAEVNAANLTAKAHDSLVAAQAALAEVTRIRERYAARISVATAKANEARMAAVSLRNQAIQARKEGQTRVAKAHAQAKELRQTAANQGDALTTSFLDDETFLDDWSQAEANAQAIRQQAGEARRNIIQTREETEASIAEAASQAEAAEQQATALNEELWNLTRQAESDIRTAEENAEEARARAEADQVKAMTIRERVTAALPGH
ncbi:MAG: hypothetical protein HQL57_10745 [Magnetococcales bacterium]|nr:hypothetical protein [Magnetococcales bacterium]MBF0157650.1 hypothetical protein [Magnetococcales bacterium]